jgi:hypothetical protein
LDYLLPVVVLELGIDVMLKTIVIVDLYASRLKLMAVVIVNFFKI